MLDISRHSTGRGSGYRLSRPSPRGATSPGSRRGTPVTPSQYRMELPPTLYGDDLVNGNSELMTQSMDPAVLAARLMDNCDQGDIMSQSVDANMLRVRHPE